MLKRIALVFTILFSLGFVGCQSLETLTPEKALAHALTANKVVAQCYADYQKELDEFSARAILSVNGLEPISDEAETVEDVGTVPIPVK